MIIGYLRKPVVKLGTLTDHTTTGRSAGPLADDYRLVKERADAAVRHDRIEGLTNAWSTAEDLMNCALACVVERQRGGAFRPYADLIIRQWGDGSVIANPENSHFGYHALAYD